MNHPKTVGIFGLGLMGASLGAALSRLKTCRTMAASNSDFATRWQPEQVVGYARRTETCEEAKLRNWVDESSTDAAEVAAAAELLVFCTPIYSIPNLIQAIRPALRPGALLTDVGSTKAELEALVADVLANSEARFVGSHPMCGSEQTGIEAARADLYEGATVFVTSACEAVDRLWESVGARVLRLPAAAHDQLVARSSHLPHLAASLLVETAAREGADSIREGIATGFQDTTRLASGSAEIWHDICKSNATAIRQELRALIENTAVLEALFEAEDFEGIRERLAKSSALRAEVMES